MIKLFSTTDNLFSSNGDKVILPLKAKVHKEDNGAFYLDLETSLDYVDDLTANRIIVANTPQGEQAFRITNVEQTRKKISAKCHHVFYDSQNYLIADSYVVDKNCNDALDHLNSATDNTSPFTTISDITKINSFRCVRKSLYEAIQTVLERWGGHLVRDNFTIAIKDKIGQDNGVVVRYAKNLKEINCDYNWDNVVTKLMPVGKDGLLLDEKYVYSDTQYDIPYTKCVSFEQNSIDEEDYKDADGNLDETSYKNALTNDLRAQAQDYVNENCKPSVNYKLKANLEKITDVGDTIVVKDERLGLDITTNVIAYDYDCILERYTEFEFGNFKQNLYNLVDSINNQTQQAIQENNAVIKVTLSEEMKSETDKIWGAMSSSHVIYDGDKILVVDTLPKEVAKNVIMINSGGIAFSNTGINGMFKSAWTIDNVLNMEQINVINLTADLIKGGTLKLGSNINQFGTLEIYDEANNLIGVLDKNGIKLNGKNIYKSLFYFSGEVVSLDVNDVYCGGTLTNGQTDLKFTIFLPKSLYDVESITINELALNIRYDGGYILTSQFVDGGYDVIGDSTINVKYAISKSLNALNIYLNKKSGTFNGKNNTAQAIEIDKLKFTCN